MSRGHTHTDAIADYILAHGIGAVSLRPVARAAGTSDRMLVYHYKSKAGVLQAGLDRIVARNTEALDAALPSEPMDAAALMSHLEAAMASPAMRHSMAVFFELASLSLRGDAVARTTGERTAQHFHEWLAARLTEPERAGELLCAVEGWGVLSAVGLDLPFPSG